MHRLCLWHLLLHRLWPCPYILSIEKVRTVDDMTYIYTNIIYNIPHDASAMVALYVTPLAP
jgi:hypothetical protein